MVKLFYDLHIHSCLSPCADENMTPANIANMAALAGYACIAVTDHNSCGNCRSFQKAAARAGIIAIPGMELNTSEEVHVLCLFAEIDAAEAFSAYVHDRLPNITPDPRLFGQQLYMDEYDGVVGSEVKLLSNAAAVGIYEVAGLMKRFGGVAVPSHVDRLSFSLYSNLGVYDPGMGFAAVELSGNCNKDTFLAGHPELSAVNIIQNSDAHSLEEIPDPQAFIQVLRATPDAVLAQILNV